MPPWRSRFQRTCVRLRLPHCVVAAADFGHSQNLRGTYLEAPRSKNWLFLGIENLFGFWIVPIVHIVLLARQ